MAVADYIGPIATAIVCAGFIALAIFCFKRREELKVSADQKRKENPQYPTVGDLDDSNAHDYLVYGIVSSIAAALFGIIAGMWGYGMYEYNSKESEIKETYGEATITK